MSASVSNESSSPNGQRVNFVLKIGVSEVFFSHCSVPESSLLREVGPSLRSKRVIALGYLCQWSICKYFLSVLGICSVSLS